MLERFIEYEDTPTLSTENLTFVLAEKSQHPSTLTTQMSEYVAE